MRTVKKNQIFKLREKARLTEMGSKYRCVEKRFSSLFYYVKFEFASGRDPSDNNNNSRRQGGGGEKKNSAMRDEHTHAHC